MSTKIKFIAKFSTPSQKNPINYSGKVSLLIAPGCNRPIFRVYCNRQRVEKQPAYKFSDFGYGSPERLESELISCLPYLEG